MQLPVDRETGSSFRLLLFWKATVCKFSLPGPGTDKERLLQWLSLESLSSTVSRSSSGHSRCARSGSLVLNNDCAVRS
jgi:hypothetical protein